MNPWRTHSSTSSWWARGPRAAPRLHEEAPGNLAFDFEAGDEVERLVEHAAYELGLDPAELRRRNFVPKTAFPWRLVNGTVYDCGDFAAALDV